MSELLINFVKPTDDNFVVSIPYDARNSSSLRKLLSKYNIGTVFKSSNTLRSILTHTKTPSPAKQQKNVIYKIPCRDCDAFYIGQTCRPLTKRIKEHEACHRLNNLVDSATGDIKSAPAKHGRDLGHTIAWSSTSIIASCQHRSQLDLLEHAAISTLEPSMNVQQKGPRVNACWHPLLTQSPIASSASPPILTSALDTSVIFDTTVVFDATVIFYTTSRL